ncbi:MAG: NAD+ synthase [Anaerolineales bacterium]|nr:NAD+ synthase [Anaerolineales bacterium]
MTADLSISTDLARQTLTQFIQSKIAEAGLSRAVLGLSGGLDSALACALAVEALGAENVLAVRMPYRTSSKDSLDHAQLLIDQLGVKNKTIEITEMVEPLFKLDSQISNLRKGNIMARQRMIILYDQSEAFKGLVVGTGNKTEILLGYSTLFGDAACAFNPIGDLYKTQVRQLARAMNIPAPILEKAPSADLWADQTDEKELGFTYEQADALLTLLVDRQTSRQSALDAGFDANVVDAVIARFRRSQFKRNAPPIAALNGGVRLPSEWTMQS